MLMSIPIPITILIIAACGDSLTLSENDENRPPNDSNGDSNTSNASSNGSVADGSDRENAQPDDGGDTKDSQSPKPSTIGTVTCGNDKKECTQGQSCCITEDGVSAACSGTCPPPTTIITCDEQADCPVGMRCRLTRAFVMTSTCVSPAVTGGELCKSNAECNGTACVPVRCGDVSFTMCNGQCGVQ